MIVDPATGEPIAYSSTAAQSVVGAAGQAAIGDPTSLAYEMLGHLPGAGTIAAWNMGRGINTIMGGGYNRGRRLGNFGTKPAGLLPRSSSFANTLSPLRLTSFSDPANITGRMADGSETYTPFNAMASLGNQAAQKLSGRAIAQEAMGKTDTSSAKILNRLGVTRDQFESVAGGNTQVFDSGVLARLGASQRLSYMRPGKDGNLSRRDRKRLAKSVYSMNRMGIDVGDIPGSNYVLDTARGGRFATGGVRAGADAFTGPRGVTASRLAASKMMGSFGGVPAQRIAGYMAGTMPLNGAASGGGAAFQKAFHASRTGMIEGTAAMNKSGAAAKVFGRQVATKEVLEAGAGKSLRLAGHAAKAGQGKFATQLATKGLTKLGSRFIPVVGQIALVADLGQMGLSALKKGAELGSDAAKSFQGQIQKPIFGMGYKDNAINATSRSRGLTAIQSSRLNARNALGHEAGMLASHFG